MPLSRDHAALLLLFQNRPTLALELLRHAFGIATEAAEPAQVETVDITEALPAELRADFVVRYLGGKKPLVVVVEVQRKRDPTKRFTWPAYVALLRVRFRCDVRLLVVAPDRGVARWCRRAIPFGNGAVFAPTVLSTPEIPAITDPDVASADPELSVLSAMAHGGGELERAVAIAQAGLSALEKLERLDADRAVIYFDLIRAALSEAARKAIDAMISQKYEFQSDFALRYIAEGKAEGHAEGKAEGQAEGKASAVIGVLEARGIALTADERARILACNDLALLDTWVRRAVSVSRAAELLA